MPLLSVAFEEGSVPEALFKADVSAFVSAFEDSVLSNELLDSSAVLFAVESPAQAENDRHNIVAIMNEIHFFIKLPPLF